eukprot:GDKI01014092.1.p1 GENE.GDKI01014092.1~~GDKI01014092.1.p1  ORF type:complete len:351 (-),score=125.91 GDKI01014092.1:159-1211(-)
MTKHVLCTGGAGYIGSHTVIHLLQAGYKVSVLDNLSNASSKVMERLREITGQEVPLFTVDLKDYNAVKQLLTQHKFDAVIHYAALKAVGESVAMPLEYYENNIGGTIQLLKAMRDTGLKVFVFSSSATVYKPSEAPLTEESALGPSNPYGQTKFMVEQLLQDLYISDTKGWRISILRYFNPVGAHPSGRIGESPAQPNNLLPYIQQVAVGRRPHLNVFGNDWPTPDGTGVRDYLHVEDLAEGHVAALNKLLKPDSEPCCMVHNLGTGKGVSVLEMAHEFEKASGKKIPVQIQPRRPGDLACVIADPSKAHKELGWTAKRSIQMACESAWKWQSNNPYGYDEAPKPSVGAA